VTGDQQLCTLSSNSCCIPDCPKAFQGQGYRNEDGAAENDVVDGVEEVAESVDVNRGRAEVPTVSLHHAAVGFSKLFLAVSLMFGANKLERSYRTDLSGLV
jgi:hypothetical protein